MLVAALKAQINALPGNQFTQAWKAIEDIDAALTKAGPTALLALKFVVERHQEQVAELLEMQQTAIRALKDDSIRLNDDHVRTVADANVTKAALAKAEAKVKRLKKKSK